MSDLLTLPADAPPQPWTYRPRIVTTAGLDMAVVARQVAAVPAMLAVQRAVCGADDEWFKGSHLEKPLRQLDAAGVALQRCYAARLAYVESGDSPRPDDATLNCAVEQYALATTRLALAIEAQAKSTARELDLAVRYLASGRATRHPRARGGVTIYPIK